MTKTLTTRKTIPLLLSFVSVILLFLFLAPTASAKTYTISGTGTKTKTLTIPKGCYQATLSWQNNGKEIISFYASDMNDLPYISTSYTTKKGKYLEGFYSTKKQKYKFSVTAAKKSKWKITLKPIKATTKLSLSGKDNKVEYVKVPKGIYKVSYTYSKNKPKVANFTASFMDEKFYAKMMQYNFYDDNVDENEVMEMYVKILESEVYGSKTSGKISRTIIVEEDSYFLFQIKADITDDKTGAVKPNHNIKWSFKLEPIKL